MNLAQALLILCFPVLGLLLFTLTVIEERLPNQPPGLRPAENAVREADRSPVGSGARMIRRADRPHGKQPPDKKQPPPQQEPAADRLHRQAS